MDNGHPLWETLLIKGYSRPTLGSISTPVAMRFQGDVIETCDHGTLAPQRPYVDAAHARPVFDPLLLWDVWQGASCSIPLDRTHLHLLQALHHWPELQGAGSNDVQPLHQGDKVTV